MVSESITDEPPMTVTAANREFVRACSEPDLYLLKVLKHSERDSGKWSVLSVYPLRNVDSSQPTLNSSLVTPDGQLLKTLSGMRLTLPPSKQLLTALVAHEWEILETMIEARALPLLIYCMETFLHISHVAPDIFGLSSDQMIQRREYSTKRHQRSSQVL